MQRETPTDHRPHNLNTSWQVPASLALMAFEPD